MAEIKVLDPHIADLIAAGEVVERPASVAKELMENAIDAGAGVITVEIAHGGMVFLRISDDGCGIGAENLPTAFLRHATSKLQSEYDLEAIGTLGFRGEALAAISAVSRIEVLSRTPEQPLGASLLLEAGQVLQNEQAGCPVGTTIVVRDLFFNTPARLKFMKKDAAEGAAVFAVVQKIALSHPEISIKFIRDGKQELLTAGDGKLVSAMYAVLGRELALGLCPVQSEGAVCTVSGFISLPSCCRSSRTWQYFFVNGRQVKSPLLMAAVEEGYKNQRMVGRFPACVIHLNMKFSAVDVNVHPAKTQVKFSDESQIFSSVYHAVLSALEAQRAHPAAFAGLSTPALTHLNPTGAIKPGDAPPSPAGKLGGNVKLYDSTVYAHGKKPTGEISPPTPRARGEKQGSTAVHTPAYAPHIEKSPPPPAAQAAPPAAAVSAHEPAAPPELPAPSKQPTQENVIDNLFENEPWHMAGEVFNTYIIVQQGEAVYFIDKHAAHERMNFDRLKAEGYQPMMQTLIVPAIFKLPPQQQEILLSHEALLLEFGFEVDELGDSIAVRQAPFDVAVEEIQDLFADLAQKLLATGTAKAQDARDALLHSMACKGAIKGGWKSSEAELARVVEAVLSGAVRYCPHGRPVAITMTKKDLERRFSRI